jgi:hypothetical protein
VRHQGVDSCEVTDITSFLSYRLAEEEIIKHITTTDADIGRAQALSLLRTWYLKTPSPKPALSTISNR